MVRMEATFNCAEGMTPDIAAQLAQLAERFQSNLMMECAGKRVLLDSLIGILSVECRRGTPLAVIADGADEHAAAEAMKALLDGE